MVKSPDLESGMCLGSIPRGGTNKFVYVKKISYVCIMKYEITLERKQRGEIIRVETRIIDSTVKPKVGEGRALLTEPPIYEKIIAVKEIKEDEKA